MDGTEITQLYGSPVNPNSTVKLIEFKRFERVSLEERKMKMEVSPQQLAQYEGGSWIVESGHFQFKIGTSSTDIRLGGDVILKRDYLIPNRPILKLENISSKVVGYF